MLQDLRNSLRSLRQYPLQAVIVVTTLGLGIGASTAIFSIVDTVLLEELPYPDPDQVYLVRTVAADGSPTGVLTPPELRPFEERADHPIVQAAAISWSQEVQIVDAEGQGHSTVRYGVTDQFFEVFGQELELGRAFERGQGPGPIVISYRIWRDLYGSDPDIVGRSIGAEGGTRTVVGVTKQDFEFPQDPGYFFLMNLGTSRERVRLYNGYVRLRPGRTAEQLQGELSAVARELGPNLNTGRPTQFVVQPFIDYVIGDMRNTVLILTGAIGVLLLIACINVTNLLLTRATTRVREVALKLSLGAMRWRIVRQLLIESLLLAVIGGAIGVAVAAGGIGVLLGMAPDSLPRIDNVEWSMDVLWFALGLTLAIGLVIGLAPAWRLARNPLRLLVNEAGRGTPGGAGGPGRNRLFSALVVTEIACAVLLVIGASLLVRTYQNLADSNAGFDSNGTLSFYLHVTGRIGVEQVTNANGETDVSASYEPVAQFFREAEERIAALPGVDAVADVTSAPLDRRQYDYLSVFNLTGAAVSDDESIGQSAKTRVISEDYFRLLGIPLRAGRSVAASDDRGSPGVAVVDETFVDRFLPGQDPLGRRIRFTENRYVFGDTGFQNSERVVDDLEIVGVVADVNYLGLAEPPEPSIYLSNEQWLNRRRTVLVHTTLDDPAGLAPLIRSEIQQMDPLLNPEFVTLDSIVETSIARERLGATLLVVFGTIALILAAVGIYGLMSYSVAQRSGEIAVRGALGAARADIMRLVMGRGIRLALAGIGLGAAGAIVMRSFIASQLYGVAVLDPASLLLAAITLFAVALLACFVPASRATRINAADLLRSE